MKKLIVYLLTILILVGCTPQPETGFNLKVKQNSVEALVGEFEPLSNIECDEGVELSVISEYDAKKYGTYSIVVEGKLGEEKKTVTYKATLLGVETIQEEVEILVNQIYDLKSNFEGNMDFDINQDDIDITKAGTYTVSALQKDSDKVLADYVLIVKEDTSTTVDNPNENTSNTNPGGNTNNTNNNNSNNNSNNSNNTNNPGDSTIGAGGENMGQGTPEPSKPTGQQVNNLIKVVNNTVTYEQGKERPLQENIQILNDDVSLNFSSVSYDVGEHRVECTATDSDKNYQTVSWTMKITAPAKNCEPVWVVDKPAWTEEVYVVDDPGTETVYETDYKYTCYFYGGDDCHLVETIIRYFSEFGSVDNFYDWYDNYCLKYLDCPGKYEKELIETVIKEGTPEVGHYETITHPEEGHWEYPEGC